MGLKEDLQKDIEKAQRKLDILNRFPEDTFPFGTIVVFSPANGSKWYYIKTNEEAWKSTQGGVVNSLAFWILKAHDSSIGYFEVYVMRTEEEPIYASS